MLENIQELPAEELAELGIATSSEVLDETSTYGAASTRRTALIFGKQANGFKARALATQAFLDDDIEDTEEEIELLEKMVSEYSSKSNENWDKYNETK